jgi:biopolymer transport protein ExbD
MSVDVGASHSKSEPNVVPLCDILLVLLIIFMVITPVLQKGIDVKLPENQSAGDPTGSSQGIVLTLERGGTIKINQIAYQKAMLESELRRIYETRQDKTIFIQADETLPYRDVLELIDIAKGAGIEVLGVVTKRYTGQ